MTKRNLAGVCAIAVVGLFAFLGPCNAFGIYHPFFVDTGFAGNFDIIEGDKNYKVNTSLIGFKKEEIKIEVQDGLLSIYAENKKQNKAFSKTITLPWDADESKAVSVYEDGVLEVFIPKTGKKKDNVREIKIK
jgi:HSP20 family molecular chaperone IbpA